nr:DMT family transporter [Variovorax terrae]
MAAWAWIPIVIWAAFAQTVRNAAQRSLTAEVGTLAATLVRFLYGLPFAALWVAALYLAAGAPVLPAFSAPYFAWVLLGAVAQLAATAFLLAAMKERNFVVAVTYSKTEVLQVALFATLFLHELPGWLSALAMGVATLGVLLLSLPKAAPAGAGSAGWVSRAAGYGLASGAGFALSAVGYRGAALALDSGSPLFTGAWGVLWAQAIQSALLGGYLAWRQPQALGAIARSWRLSTLAGMMGALASIGWFTAFSLRPATDVRTLGLVEVLFSYLVSRRIFHEKLSRAERAGLLLVTAGVLGVCAQL